MRAGGGVILVMSSEMTALHVIRRITEGEMGRASTVSLNFRGALHLSHARCNTARGSVKLRHEETEGKRAQDGYAREIGRKRRRGEIAPLKNPLVEREPIAPRNARAIGRRDVCRHGWRSLFDCVC